MNTTFTIWQAYLASARNALRYDTRMKVAVVVALFFNFILGLWSANQSITRLHQWQVQGTTAVNTGLWLLCLSTWAGIAFFALIGTMRQALGSDEALLLFTLPIPPATRFRTLYGSFFVSIEGLWAWLLLEIGVTGYVLAINAFSGEGNRLTLYLTAPFSLSQLLRGRLTLFLLPTLLEGLLIGCFLAWRLELPINQTGFVISAIMLMITGILTFLVWGSTWDEDLNIAVEGIMETLMQEEAPVTPKRMWLLNMGVGLLAGMFLLVWKLPPLWTIVSLVLLDAGIMLGMRQFGYIQLRVGTVGAGEEMEEGMGPLWPPALGVHENE